MPKSLKGQTEVQQRPFQRVRGSVTAPEAGHGIKRWQVPSKWTERHQYPKDGRGLKLSGLPMEV